MIMMMIDQGVVIHEMLHNLGVGHEQNRPDRNSLMSVDWTNIPIDKVLAFSASDENRLLMAKILKVKFERRFS